MAGSVRDRTREFFLTVQSARSRVVPTAKINPSNNNSSDVASRRKRFSTKAAQVTYNFVIFCRSSESYFLNRSGKTYTEPRISSPSLQNVWFLAVYRFFIWMYWLDFDLLVAKSKSLFDDPAAEISELSFVITQAIFLCYWCSLYLSFYLTVLDCVAL